LSGLGLRKPKEVFYANAKKVNHDASPREGRDGHQPHGRSLASDPHGSGKCHYDDGIIFDHAIAAFLNFYNFGLNRRRRVSAYFVRQAPRPICIQITY
jgi:hypothetical protein